MLYIVDVRIVVVCMYLWLLDVEWTIVHAVVFRKCHAMDATDEPCKTTRKPAARLTGPVMVMTRRQAINRTKAISESPVDATLCVFHEDVYCVYRVLRYLT